MPDNVTVTGTSRTSAKVMDDFVFEAGTTTRKVARAELVANPHDDQATVKVTLFHQRKSQNDTWEDCEHFNLSCLPAHEEVRLALTSSATRNLWEWVGKLRAVFEQVGIPLGTQEFIVGTKEEIVLTDPERAQALRVFMAKEQPEELLRALAEHAPEDLLNQMSLGRLQQVRQKALAEFETMMGQDLPEANWQSFLDANQWIFGYGLRYQILRPVTGQPQYGGANVFGRGGQRGDNLMATDGKIRFTVLVEIKKPQTPLLRSSEYREKVWWLHGELQGAVSQVQVNCQTWERGAEAPDNLRSLESQGIFTREPKGILVIGHTNQLSGPPDVANIKRSTFESFRRNLHNPEVITFDELLARARFIVDHGPDAPMPEAPEEHHDTGEELPF